MPRLRRLLFVALCSVVVRAFAAAPPNIVLILADDLGWSDLGCYGADLHETPRLDQLARESVRFTQAYAMSVCTPTRSMLMTGKHAARLGMTIWSEGSLRKNRTRRMLDGDSRHDLAHSERTLATHLREAGYFTAHVGKWHLGDANHYPETHGFDVNIGGTHWGAPETFFWPYRGASRFPEYRYVPHLDFGSPGEYLTDRLTDEALRVLDRARDGGKPFFLYLAHYAPHTPIEAKPADVRHFEAKLRREFRHQNATYAAMVRSLDENVGRILDHLAARGLAENTIVIFTSDNGGFIGVDRKLGPTPVTNNAPLRSGKGSLYEGGIRVPLLVRWPGVTPRGASCDTPVLLADLFPTLLGAGTDGRNVSAVDGLNLRELLAQPAGSLARDTLFFHYPHYYATTTPAGAVRAGDWKLLEYFEDGRVELFNLRSDPGEQRDLARSEPERAGALRARLAQWRQEVGAQMPTVNPGFSAKK